MLDELVKIGLLEAQQSTKKVNTFFGGAEKEEPAKIYTVTKRGEAHIFGPEDRGLRTLSGSRVCYGKYEVVKVVNFTEPADLLGQRISRGNYTFKLSEISSWAKDSPLLQEHVKSLARDVKGGSVPLEGEAVLILTNNGWIYK